MKKAAITNSAEGGYLIPTRSETFISAPRQSAKNSSTAPVSSQSRA